VHEGLRQVPAFVGAQMAWIGYSPDLPNTMSIAVVGAAPARDRASAYGEINACGGEETTPSPDSRAPARSRLGTNGAWSRRSAQFRTMRPGRKSAISVARRSPST